MESDNSNTTNVKTLIDAETLADSTALVEILNAVSPEGLNWGAARLRDWEQVTLDNGRTRVVGINLNSRNATGALPNPFSEAVMMDNGLSELTNFAATDNSLTGLIDFTGTSIQSISVENNNLSFEDLEPILPLGLADAAFTYAPQADVMFIAETDAGFLKDTELDRLGVVRIAPRGTDYTLMTGLGGVNNVYSWTREGGEITGGTEYTVEGSNLTINSIDIGNMGLFGATVTNGELPALTLTVLEENVFAVVDVAMRLTDFDDVLLPSSERFTGALLETEARGSGYDTLARTPRTETVGPEFTFEDVILGDYLCGIDPENRDEYVPTYFGDAFTWEEADTIEIRAAVTLPIKMTEEPPAPTGEGNLDVVISEDFGDEDARVDARRRAKKRKCGLRRRRTGGRVAQDNDDFELFAYGETDDNGEFKFGFLPEGTYRFFVEYPGIPLDPTAEVEFTVGEQGISDTEFALIAEVTEAGVVTTLDRVLGVILTYFKDLRVYPNPTEDYIRVRYRHLKSREVSAELVDLSGKRKWSQELEDGYEGKLDIDIQDLETGIYLLRFYDRNSRNENVVTYRVMVR